MEYTKEKGRLGDVEAKPQITKKEYSKNPLVAFGLSVVCITGAAASVPIAPAQASSAIRSSTTGISSLSGLYTSGTGTKRTIETRIIPEVKAMPTPNNQRKIQKTTSTYRGELPFVDNYQADDLIERLLPLSNMVKRGKSISKFKGALPKKKY